MKSLTNSWSLLFALPFVLGSVKFWFQIYPNLPEDASIIATWGQAIGSVVPIGIIAFALFAAARFLKSKVN
ncbi:hypothetical protein ALP8811_00325 [Aliiroseovarius pelagivivens]|uniref:Uncharacterized protein n=1 Tax=Aliiroseovarius pelagivivens TaxID=1639690 RepID=A0A2R8AH41_9RHOB|nr:hypothetical protein ALP8811_00325 [Aliiroseovarius pelagivivens]